LTICICLHFEYRDLDYMRKNFQVSNQELPRKKWQKTKRPKDMRP